MTTITIKGLEQLQGKLNDLAQLEPVKDALKAAAQHVEGKIKPYPPSSEANVPNQRFWYERGYGPKWMRADMSIGGKKTSEDLRGKWTIDSRNNGLTWIVGNNVTYGPFVQGDKQAAFHKRRNWKTTDDVAKSEEKTVVTFVEKEIEKLLNK